MLRTRFTDLFGIKHPVVMGGMGLGVGPELVAAVSDAGGLGIQGGCAQLAPREIGDLAASIRKLTDRPFGLNLLLFLAHEEQIEAVLDARSSTFSTSWARPDQDLSDLFARAHHTGAKVMHMVSSVQEARRAAEAGADVIVAQGAEGGGHVGLMSTVALVPMVVREVAPIPVVAAGGLADGAGLAAMLMLGAEGALYGTRFLATKEATIPAGFKRALVEGDGHDTIVTEIPDIARGQVWPGAYARVKRNRFIETWLGREGDLRYRQGEVAATIHHAFEADDTQQGVVYMGQSAGLIPTIEPAAEVVEHIIAEATAILTAAPKRLLLAGSK